MDLKKALVIHAPKYVLTLAPLLVSLIFPLVLLVGGWKETIPFSGDLFAWANEMSRVDEIIGIVLPLSYLYFAASFVALFTYMGRIARSENDDAVFLFFCFTPFLSVLICSVVLSVNYLGFQDVKLGDLRLYIVRGSLYCTVACFVVLEMYMYFLRRKSEFSTASANNPLPS